MATPLLSIVIPTYNRAAALGPLLQDVQAVLAQHGERVQLVVCDNHCTDESPALIEHCRAAWPQQVKVIARPINLGMEGNIACAMIEGDGKYIWTVSDHQRLCVPAVMRTVELMQTLEFDIAHAKLVQWSAALQQRNTVSKWSDIDRTRRGALLFYLGNLSTLVFRREIALAAIKNIFRSCVWSYPHLGLIGRMGAATRIVEFENMSSLPEVHKGAPSLVHDYDKIAVRFRSNIVCVFTLAEEAGLDFNRRGFFTPEYRAAFRGGVLNFLLQPGVSRKRAWRTLWPVALCNPGSLRLTALFVLLCMFVVPSSLRISIANAARARVIGRRQASSAGS